MVGNLFTVMEIRLSFPGALQPLYPHSVVNCVKNILTRLYLKYLSSAFSNSWLVVKKSILDLLNRHWRHPLHLVRGQALAQRLLHLRCMQGIPGGQGLHHRWGRYSLSWMRQAKTYVKDSSRSVTIIILMVMFC